MSRDIYDLEPETAKMCQDFLDLARGHGYNVILTATYRSFEEQDALYAQGRTKKGNIVTNARGGQSLHNHRVAFDFAPVKDGKIDWNDTKTWEALGKLGEQVGLEWGGRWKFKDMPHLQKRGFKIPK